MPQPEHTLKDRLTYEPSGEFDELFYSQCAAHVEVMDDGLVVAHFHREGHEHTTLSFSARGRITIGIEHG